MVSIQDQAAFLERLAKGIATLFGNNCEVAVHDLNRDYENTIIAIENGHVSGRRVGDGASELVLKTIRDTGGSQEDRYSYLAQTKDGRIVKCCSVYLKDDTGKPVGLFGINYDVTDMMMARNALDDFVNHVEPDSEEQIDTTITTNVVDLLNQLIEEADRYVGKPVAMMSKDDKTKAIQFLSDKGAFLIKKAGDKVSKHYDISKYTLYNYMDAE